MNKSYDIPDGGLTIDDSLWIWEVKGVTRFYSDTIRLTFDDSVSMTYKRIVDSTYISPYKTSYVFDEDTNHYRYIPEYNNALDDVNSYRRIGC